ncbi:hypothetical protein TI05_10045, partial [Achromatium sp. WMS3]
ISRIFAPSSTSSANTTLQQSVQELFAKTQELLVKAVAAHHQAVATLTTVYGRTIENSPTQTLQQQARRTGERSDPAFFFENAIPFHNFVTLSFATKD